MSRHQIHFGFVAVVIVSLGLPCARGQTPQKASGPSDIVYEPPPHSHGDVRVENSAQSRGPSNGLPSLFILAPDHVGLTTKEQPVLFWYLSKATDTPLVMTLMTDDPKAKDPVFETKLDASKDGIQCVDLSKFPVKLKAGVDYQISLALKPANKPDGDVFCSAEIRHVDPPPALVAQILSTPDPLDKARLLARNGMFYDALTLVSHEIDGNANSKAWRERRASLLDQVGLAQAASFDRLTPPELHASLVP
jgi:uncharacterized protein DUF928